MARLKEIVFDSVHPAAQARFWAGVLEGYEIRAYDAEEIARLASLGLTPETDPVVMVDGPGPTLCFHRIDPPRYDNNRIHLDIATRDRMGEVARLAALGAKVQRDADGYTVMADPEGNQFCVVDER